MRDVLLTVDARVFIGLCIVLALGIPIAMVALSVGVPPLRNPLFLVIGGLVGLLLVRRLWLIRREAGS